MHPATFYALSDLAKDKSLLTQTQIAENPEEIALGKELFGQGCYAEVYQNITNMAFPIIPLYSCPFSNRFLALIVTTGYWAGQKSGSVKLI